MALKWGIASAGKISHDFVNAMGTLSEGIHHVVAVAARDLDRAEDFAKRFDIPKAYGSYKELAQDPDVEVVYVGTLNPQHLEVGLLMLEHGKHVLVEKPLCLNEKQAQQLITYAEQKKLFLMEAIWSRFFPSYQYVRNQIKNGMLGDITMVEADIGSEGLDKVARIAKKDLGGGTVVDLGVYLIQFCQWVYEQAPKSINARGTLNEEGVDLEMFAEMTYGDNKMAKIKSSGLTKLSRNARIVGTKGQITLLNFNGSTTIIDVDGTQKTWSLPQAQHYFNLSGSCGLRYEAEEVRKCIREGKMESNLVTHNESLLIARIEDEIRKQIGVKYPEDD
ncbi:trans-1,2-dihydrobenzene-1,2-diol dehydrogenase-like [Sitodiplosis mosellana]|uniref:trans-1,2-dihydrobenzene-1,2-diol dehydrogenase-like n=1 Tax=Sitodiplosis mosellana TaxID=263140 RepID=UPI0024451B85|nr:trans-1,2-dihydrobenzene-1,2-diol dehydrogenase-like [Sitodiplosis mosellana]